MKRVLLMVCSICLVLACIFGLFACVAGVKDILNINDYKNADAEFAREGIAQARDGLAQLQENEATYLDGAVTYVNGVAQLAAGRAQLADGKAQVAAGEKELAAGQKMIDDNTQAYLEGKELISTLEGFMPYIQGIANALQSIRDFNAGLPLVGGTIDQYLGQLRAAVLNFLADSSAVAAISDMVGMDVGSLLRSNPEDTSICGNVVKMYNDGLAQLKQYEDGLKQLEEGKAALADGKAQVAQGEKELAAGVAQLADGNAQLMVYEDGEMQIIAGMKQLMEAMLPSYRQNSFEQTGASLPEMLAETDAMKAEVPADILTEEGFNDAAYAAFVDTMVDKLYAVDANGNRVTVRGNDHVNLDNCILLCDTAEQYLNDQEGYIKGEVFVRIGMYAAAALAAIFGIIAGITGIVSSITGGKKTGKTCGVLCAILAVAANIVGLFTHYADYIYPTRIGADGKFAVDLADMANYQYSGDLQLKALIVLAVVAVLFVIFASIAKKAAKQKEAASYDDSVQAAAAAGAAAAASDDRLAKLEAENADLKAMVAELAADAATVKD